MTNTIGASLVRCGDYLYLLGGEERLACRYDPTTDTWTQLTKPRHQYDYYTGSAALVHGDTILLCGGLDSKDIRIVRATLVEIYHTQTDQWVSSDIEMPFEYYKFACILPE